MNKIVNVWSKLNLSTNQEKTFNELSSELKTIKKAIPKIDSIIVRGGFIPDTLLNCKPKDIDLFYSIKDNKGTYSEECLCDNIRRQVNKFDLKLIGQKYKYDLENSYEKEPRLSPIERTVGFFSYHTDWFSMFCLDSFGNIWTNQTAFNYFKRNIFEIRYQGSLPWAYFPKETDSNDYYISFVCEIIRGISHVNRRKLKIGADFAELLHNAPFILEKAKNSRQRKRAISYMEQKFGNITNLKQSIKELNLEGSQEIIQGFVDLNRTEDII